MKALLLPVSFAIALLACGREKSTPAPPPSAPDRPHAVAASTPSFRPSPTPQSTDCSSVERVGGDVTDPIELSRVQPEYPDATGHRFSSSLFILEAVVDRNGFVHDVHFLRAPEITPPLPAFNAAIVKAISSWRYKPATLNGHPVCVYLTVTVSIHFQ